MKASRTALLSLAGLALAMLAEACSLGLVGLSGWFISSSAVAGASAYSTFSYLNPSGGVRAFALGRIGAQYASRVVLHGAALRRITAARLRFYDRAVAEPVSQGKWSGQSLDRVMADADSTGMTLILGTAPVVVAAAMTVGGCLVMVLAGYSEAAAIVAAAAAACAALAVASAQRSDDGSRARGALRTELVTAIDAWAEMASLGAADQLARRTLQRLTSFEQRRLRQSATQARTAGVARAISAAAVPLAVVSGWRSGADVSMLVLLALLAAGVLSNAERLAGAAQARLAARQAGARLDTADAVASVQPGVATYERDVLTVSGYSLPATPTRPARMIEFTVVGGQTVVVTGVSGSGKTTLLNAIAASLGRRATVVLAEDYLFTGTVADNIRLADPAISEDDLEGLLSSMQLAGVGPNTATGVGGRALSGGEQRRLHIARALATQPDVLLVDEPTTGLDTVTGIAVLAAIRRRLPHASIVLTMHQPPEDPEVLGPNWTTVSLGDPVPARKAIAGASELVRS